MLFNTNSKTGCHGLKERWRKRQRSSGQRGWADRTIKRKASKIKKIRQTQIRYRSCSERQRPWVNKSGLENIYEKDFWP